MKIHTRSALALAVLATLLAVPEWASAQAEAKVGLSGWSVVGSETVSPGRPVIDVQTGWPSTTFGYTFGLSGTNDISLRLGLLYAAVRNMRSRWMIRAPTNTSAAQWCTWRTSRPAGTSRLRLRTES